jgi:Cu/Zn superoxide dismutase
MQQLGMHRRVLCLTLGMAMAAWSAGTVGAQSPSTVTHVATLHSVGRSGASGAVRTLYRPAGGLVTMTVHMRGLQAGATYRVELFRDTCRHPTKHIGDLPRLRANRNGTGHTAATAHIAGFAFRHAVVVVRRAGTRRVAVHIVACGSA